MKEIVVKTFITVMIIASSLAGVLIPSVPASAEIAGEPDVYRLDYQVDVGANDALEVWNNESVGTTTDFLLAIGNDFDEPFYDCNFGTIFSSVDVPTADDVQILSAYVSLYSNGEGYRDLVAYIYGEDTPNAESYIDEMNASVSIRNRTNEYVYVDGDSEELEWCYVDVTPIVRELIASPNWSTGDNMSFLFIHDDEYEVYAGVYAPYEGYEHEVAPKLTIYYAPISETHYVIPFDTGTDGYTKADAGFAQAYNESDPCSCDDYHALNAQTNGLNLFPFYFMDAFYIGSANQIMGGEEICMWAIARGILGFNTSTLPDDASITNAELFVNARATLSNESEGESTSVIVMKYTASDVLEHMTGEPDTLYYNRSIFVDNLGVFYSDEFPYYPWIVGIPNTSAITIKTELSDVEDYISKTGYTLFGLRSIDDINDVCPVLGEEETQNGSTLVIGLTSFFSTDTSLNSLEPSSPTWLAIDITEEEEGAPIIDNPPVEAMTIIMGLVFTIIGMLGILAVLFKGEGLLGWVRIGLLTGMAIFMIIGVVILQSIIVAVT